MSESARSGMPGGMARLIGSLRALGTMRLAALGVIGIATLGLLGYMALRGSTPPMSLLYGDLDQRDASQIVSALDRARVPYRIGRGGTEILAPEDQVPRLRLSLAKEGLPAGGSVGYEIFDRQNGLTATPFQQDMNRLRGLEGELARSIRSLDGVASARVHLVLPRREAFSRERAEAQGSVVLQMRGAQRLDREGVQAVVQLVAAAVPGLKPQNVAVVDGRGELLSRTGNPGEARTQEEARRAQEQRMARSIEEMLERTLGAGRVRAETTIEFDNDRVQTTEERFDAENQVPRSQTSVNETNRTGEAQNVSVANQLPGAPAAAGGSGGGPQTQEARQEETINYEIGRTTRSTMRDQPILRRVSVAVLVDGVWEPGETAGAAARFRERTPEELTRISALVRGAIGYNEQRGDRLEIASMRFADPALGQDEAAGGGLLGLPPLTPTLTARLIESGLFALIALAALLLIGRPIVSKVIAGITPRPAAALPEATAGRLPAPEGSLPKEMEDALADVAMVQGPIRVSSLTGLADLVERHPEESLAVIRRWLSPDDAAGKARS